MIIDEVIQAMNELKKTPAPPLAIAGSYRVIGRLTRSPLFVEKDKQVSLVP